MKRKDIKKRLPRLGLFSMMFLVSAIFSVVGLAQTPTWQLVTPPKLGYPSSISVYPDSSGNPNRVFVTAEHDGAWDTKTGGALTWTAVVPDYGLYEVHIARIVADPNTGGIGTPYTLYMSTTQGGSIAQSTDDGNSWPFRQPNCTSPVDIHDTMDRRPTPALAFDPSSAPGRAGSMLAGLKRIIRRSTDYGCTWNDVTTFSVPAANSPTVVTDIKYVGATSNVVWAATSDSPIYPIETPGAVPVHTPNPPTTHLGCAGVYRSADAAPNVGLNWTQKLINPNNSDALENCVYAIGPIPTTVAGCGNGNCAYAATRNGLYYTSTGDQAITTWAQQTIFNGATNISSSVISNVVYTSSPTLTIYIGTAIGTDTTDSPNDGIYKSTALGGNFARAPGFTLTKRVYAMGALATASNTLYVAYATGDLYKTTDGGATTTNTTTWGTWNYQPPAAPTGAHAGYPMATVAVTSATISVPETVYVGTVCQDGIQRRDIGGGWTMMQKDPSHIQDNHSHFHYVMRLVWVGVGIVIATDDDDVWITYDNGTSWQLIFDTTKLKTGGYHLHGLAAGPSSTMYVGTGFGNWPEEPVPDPQIWLSTDGGTSWKPSGPLPNWGINTTNCTNDPAGSRSACTSLYTIAVSPTDSSGNTVYVGTFGSENYPSGITGTEGTARGVIRRNSTDGGATWFWEAVNYGLCTDAGVCTGTPTPPAKSLWVGEVAIDSNGTNVYIATLNGLYRRAASAPLTTPWQDISPTGGIAWRRFESIAVDPNNPNHVFAGTSEMPNSNAKIYEGTYNGISWTWSVWNPVPPMVLRAWAGQYRVRDIQFCTGPVGGCLATAYAVIEGGGIYAYTSAVGGLSPLRR